jgi:hypothetical protein
VLDLETDAIIGNGNGDHAHDGNAQGGDWSRPSRRNLVGPRSDRRARPDDATSVDA